MSNAMPPDFHRWSEQLAGFGRDAERMRADLASSELVGTSPDGSIRATMRSGKLAALSIAPSALNHDISYLEGQILAAVRDGERQTAEMMTRSTEPMTEALRNLIREAGK
jgi:DNA-binding protein YbaB